MWVIVEYMLIEGLSASITLLLISIDSFKRHANRKYTSKFKQKYQILSLHLNLLFNSVLTENK